MATAPELMRIVERNGGKVVQENGEPCFVLHSGMHTRVKYDFERVFQYYHARKEIAEALVTLADNIKFLPHSPLPSVRKVSVFEVADVLVGDISMGSFLGSMQYDSRNLYMRLAFAKKKDGAFVFDKNCDFLEQDRILLVDDVLTTGKTVVALADALRHWYAEHFSPVVLPRIIGSAVLLDRSSALIPPPSALDFVPRPLFSLFQDSDSKIYHACECPYHAK